MEADAYREMAATEDAHWWFVARRKILACLIGKLHLPAGARILEIGAGTGGNLAMLSRYGSVDGVEHDPEARRLAAQKSSIPLLAGSLPDHLPTDRGSYDLVCMFDVLEHIADDQAALAAVRQTMKPGGRLILTVPAYPWLWSAHDVQLHHQRRYTAASLRDVAARAGFRCARMSYFNSFLMPLVIIGRLVDRLRSSRAVTGTAIPGGPINTLFRQIFASERFVLPYVSFPTGASLYAELI
ncbi:MAG TPA: class I SAM-dependent methyltransferase [Terriglobales bacterium]|nr:class I SAM-dependent methyltransferase [Terriglobales bacterium]